MRGSRRARQQIFTHVPVHAGFTHLPLGRPRGATPYGGLRVATTPSRRSSTRAGRWYGTRSWAVPGMPSLSVSPWTEAAAFTFRGMAAPPGATGAGVQGIGALQGGRRRLRGEARSDKWSAASRRLTGTRRSEHLHSGLALSAWALRSSGTRPGGALRSRFPSAIGGRGGDGSNRSASRLPACR
jgi:hypothetical protein